MPFSSSKFVAVVNESQEDESYKLSNQDWSFMTILFLVLEGLCETQARTIRLSRQLCAFVVCRRRPPTTVAVRGGAWFAEMD